MTASGEFGDVRGAVAEANRGLAAAGLVSIAFGNVSQVDRASAVMAIKPSGLPCSSITPDDVVVVRLADGEVVWGEQRPSSDTPTHRILYNALPGIGGIAHTHSRFATGWAQAGRAIPCLGTTHADSFRGEVPVTRSLTAPEIAGDYEDNTGLVIVELFGPGRLDPLATPGALVVSHGPFVWGDDAVTAVGNAEALELIAMLAMTTLTIAGGQPPSGEALAISEELADRHYSRKHGPDAYYGQK